MGRSSRFGYGYAALVLWYYQWLLACGDDHTNYCHVLELAQRGSAVSVKSVLGVALPWRRLREVCCEGNDTFTVFAFYRYAIAVLSCNDLIAYVFAGTAVRQDV